MKIGFIGLGQMGGGIAANILKAGHELVVFNRTAAKAEPLVAKGAVLAPDVAAACRADAVFTMLANDEALSDVSFGEDGIVANLVEGAVHVSMSTISIALSARLAEAHEKARQHFVAAPVFGRPAAAEAAQLFVVAAGQKDVIEKLNPVLTAVGQKTTHLSENPVDANLVKLSGNFMIASVIETLGEAMALVGKQGIDKHVFLDILTSGLFNAPVYKTYGALIADQTFEPAGFAAPLGKKDVGLVLSAAESLKVPMPVASLLRDRFIALLAQGGDKLDWSAISSLSIKDAAA